MNHTEFAALLVGGFGVLMLTLSIVGSFCLNHSWGRLAFSIICFLWGLFGWAITSDRGESQIATIGIPVGTYLFWIITLGGLKLVSELTYRKRQKTAPHWGVDREE